jgi:leader peptidase (prepilin peptidase)/N-methyltransferase
MNAVLEFFSHTGPLGMPFHFWTAVAFIFGAMVGSFLNVVVWRLPQGMSIVRPGSRCPHCQKAIPLWLNIPIVSWVWLCGKSVCCQKPISARYVIVEAVTAAMFVACWMVFGEDSPLEALAVGVLLAGMLAASLIDFDHVIIPDSITFGGMVVGFLFSAATPALHGAPNPMVSMQRSALGMLVGGGLIYGVLRLGKLLFGRRNLKIDPGSKIIFHETAVIVPGEEIPYEEIFYRKSDVAIAEGARIQLADRCYLKGSVRLTAAKLRINDDEFDPENEPYLEMDADKMVVSREAMGLGDVKFMAAIGAFLGWQATFFSLMVSAFLGAVFGMTLIAIGKRELSSRLQYGPFIALAAALWAFGGDRWCHAYIAF